MLVLITATSFAPAALAPAGVVSIFFSSLADAPPPAMARPKAAVRNAVQARAAMRAPRARSETWFIVIPSIVVARRRSLPAGKAGILPERPVRRHARAPERAGERAEGCAILAPTRGDACRSGRIPA